MNRRSFFSIVAAVVVAPMAILSSLRRPAESPRWRDRIERTRKSLNERRAKHERPPVKRPTIIECVEDLHARCNEAQARELLDFWGVPKDQADREIARAKAEIKGKRVLG